MNLFQASSAYSIVNQTVQKKFDAVAKTLIDRFAGDKELKQSEVELSHEFGPGADHTLFS